jgi:hypothetical protein
MILRMLEPSRLARARTCSSSSSGRSIVVFTHITHTLFTGYMVPFDLMVGNPHELMFVRCCFSTDKTLELFFSRCFPVISIPVSSRVRDLLQ